MLYDITEIRYCLLKFFSVDIIIGKCIVPFLPRPPVDGIPLHVADNVLGIIQPVFLNIAFGEPRACLTIYGRLSLVQPAHVRKRSRSLVERTFVELRASHKHPCLPQERVVLTAVKPLDVTLGLLSVLRPLRTLLYAVAGNSFLSFLNGTVVVCLAEITACLVADSIQRNHLGEVVLVAFLLLQRTVYIRLCAIKISVVFGIESMPEPGARCVFLGRASRYHQDNYGGNQRNDISVIM